MSALSLWHSITAAYEARPLDIASDAGKEAMLCNAFSLRPTPDHQGHVWAIHAHGVDSEKLMESVREVLVCDPGITHVCVRGGIVHMGTIQDWLT